MSVRERQLKDGTKYWQVRFRENGRESSASWNNPMEAEKFDQLVKSVGPTKAREIYRIVAAPEKTTTVEQWLTHHIDHLTGVEQKTLDEYRRYVKKDIAPILGPIPLTHLTEEDVARWVQSLEDDGARPKTIANKHGFLSGALAKAVPKRIPVNPAAGRRLPRGEGDAHEMVFLTQSEFAHLNSHVSEPWRPTVEFLVASGCRISEALALQPADVNIDRNTVRVARAWKRSSRGYHIGPPKTERSKRTINVPATTLAKLDYTGEWLFANPGRGRRNAGGPVRAVNFRANVWWPAVERAGLNPRPRVHDLRHTCASWLLQAGVPIPVVSRHLGHESIQVTVDVYGHIDRTSAEAAAFAMQQALGG